MWTPRRVVLLLAGVLFFGGSYAGYARLLGWLDGLPQLPEKFQRQAAPGLLPPERATSPTVERLKEAFGPDCPEQSDQNYPTKLEFRNGESSVVLAAGAAPLIPNSNRMTLAPFSLAVFGKPLPPHLRQPGEVVEISTFHADKAILEFDRPINNPNDMNRARLLRLELVSEPEQALPDPRRGVVHITTNQRSADPNRYMVLRTPGPVFYRDPKNNPEAGTGPDVWTDAAVEITDRQNLPRAYGAPAPATALARGTDLRDPAAVPAILSGQRLPPPTITAIGMKVYLDPEPKQPSANPLPKKPEGSAGFSGVRRIELRERVLINLWVDARQGFVGGTAAGPAADTPPPPKTGSALALVEPPSATAGVVGSTFYASQSARQLDRALLQIETLGPFAYDVEKNLARFETLPQADPKLPNDVQVTRIPPRGTGQQKLFTQVLEIEFNGPPTAGAAPPAPGAPPKPDDAGGSSFKLLHAWTTTPGRYLTVASEDDRLEAYGHDLLFEQAANRTTLIGAPLYAVRSNEPKAKVEKAGGSVLTAGAPNRPAKLVMEPGPGPDKKTVANVEGPGQIEMVEPGADATPTRAFWLTRMTHAKETLNGRELDRLTFTDGAKFEDTKADYWLKGKELKLWLESGGKPDGPTKALPQRLQATGDVTSHSADFDIEQAEFLSVMFRDGTPPPPPKVTAPVGPPAPPPMAAAPVIPPPTPLDPKAPPAEPPKEKPKPPLKLKARVVDTWVVRYPVPKVDPKVDPKADPKPDPKAAEKPDPKPDPKADAEPALKYELEKARCEGQVIVHQDPDDPEKPRGLDVQGNTLLLDKTPDGSVMTVTGTEKEPGQVHHEGMSILGPKVVIDQLHNVCTVEGGGALSMPAGSDLSGNELKEPETLVVLWRDSMIFSGSTKTAEFVGRVRATQGDSGVICHTLQVHLDREVYFNQLGKKDNPKAAAAVPKDPRAKDAKDPGAKPKENDGPKVERVYCYPAPEDNADEPKGSGTVTFVQVERDETGKVVKVQQVVARELTVFTQAQDDGRGEKYQKVMAHGPGTVRIWQPGDRDMTGPTPGQPPMPQPPPQQPPGAPKTAAAKPPEMEMKLTIVTFSGRMDMKDKGKVYQEATFRGDVLVLHAPAESPTANVERHRMPPRSVVLTCSEQLVVSTHKRKDAPPAQRMDATGNAFIRSDEYDGWGELITYDGQFVVLEGRGTSQARIMSRFQNTENSGKRIVYNRSTGGYRVDESYGGTIQQSGPAAPPPKKK
jgi:hypothetical protein